MNLIDVHCHLTHQAFQDDLDKVIERAKKASLKVIICSGVNHPTNEEALILAKKYPQLIKASFGLYPIDLLGKSPDEVGLTRQTSPIDLETEFAFIKKYKDMLFAVGECGLDFYWSEKAEEHQQQEINFRKIIRFTKSVKKPLVVHSRKAEEECLNILGEEVKSKEIPIIMHCFSGRKALMTRAISQGYYFSIPPHIVKSSNFQTLVKKAPLRQLLTETDAPWLSPYEKNKRNEPAFVVEAVKKIAEIKNLKEPEVADQIWQNYLQLSVKN